MPYVWRVGPSGCRGVRRRCAALRSSECSCLCCSGWCDQGVPRGEGAVDQGLWTQVDCCLQVLQVYSPVYNPPGLSTGAREPDRCLHHAMHDALTIACMFVFRLHC